MNTPTTNPNLQNHPQKLESDSVFVYGTLKRGQCRENLWPVPPIKVTPGWILAKLFGREDYPAIVPGNDQVMGECWRFTAQQMPAVIKRLDQIEGTNQAGEPDLYVRKLVMTFSMDGITLGESYCYFYASDPESDGFERITLDKPPEDKKSIIPTTSSRGMQAERTSSRFMLQWPDSMRTKGRHG